MHNKTRVLFFLFGGVRESEASIWLKDLLGIHIPITCDPTSLFDVSFWNRYADDSGIKGNYILTYMGPKNNQHIKDAIEYGKQTGLPVYNLSGNSKSIRGVKKITPLSFGLWLSIIANPSMTFTGSFHGLMFSLYFHKEFFYYLREHSNSRLHSIAKECAITNRLGTKDNLQKKAPIDYNFVDHILLQKRQDSYKYLKSLFYKDSEL